jgi:hypothetical protein
MVNRRLYIAAMLFVGILFSGLAFLKPVFKPRWQRIDYDETFYRIKNAISADPNFSNVRVIRNVAILPTRYGDRLNNIVGRLPFCSGKKPFRTMNNTDFIRIYQNNLTTDSSKRLNDLVISLNHDPYILVEHRQIQSP